MVQKIGLTDRQENKEEDAVIHLDQKCFINNVSSETRGFIDSNSIYTPLASA
jgi:hypothetical protein